jgi:alkaline phosphatase D
VDFTVAGIASSPLFGDLYATARKDHPDFGSIVYRATDEGVEPVWHMTMMQGVLSSYTYNKTGLRGLADWLGPNPANPGLRYIDTTTNGYGLAAFDASECRVQFVSLEDCTVAFKTPPAVRYRATFSLPLWQGGAAPVLAAPEFDGPPPFPFSTATV